MPRIQFDLPPEFPFSTEVQIYISHVNQGGHLDNAQLLTLVSEGRVRFFRWLGYSERDIEGAQIVVADLVAQYKSEAFHGETIRLSMTPQAFNSYGFDLVYQLSESSTGREVARGKIGVVFVRRAEPRGVVPIPEAFSRRLEEHLAQAAGACPG